MEKVKKTERKSVCQNCWKELRQFEDRRTKIFAVIHVVVAGGGGGGDGNGIGISISIGIGIGNGIGVSTGIAIDVYLHHSYVK
ncbi:unnamed protein product [Litomosoides sigmodontis]|uniref:Uncharacterized protein n=1 Tax=Litomosoides sigmodontis TaxID=42156 RepID=A0A3P6T086_LITSI|nr:unnamed protein product [Litomosoides sigmodontis]